MSRLASCPTCKKEVSTSAKRCPHCGERLKLGVFAKLVLTAVAILGFFAFLGYLFGGAERAHRAPSDSSASSSSDASSSSQPETTATIGSPFRTDKFEITVTKVERRSKVGIEYANSVAPEGGTYVCVTWKCKNISNEPIKAYRNPELKLLDASEVEYSPDIGASAYYATECNITQKILSDLNPGITISSANVFELDKGAFDKKTWVILVKADDKVRVRLVK